MRFIVYGAGAIGGVIGALLYEHGSDVLLVARGAHATAIQESGLTFESATGRRALPIPVALSPPALGGDDVVLLAMKSQDTRDALMALRPVAAPTTPGVIDSLPLKSST